LALKVVDKNKFKDSDKLLDEVKIIQKLTQVYPKCKGANQLLCYRDIYEDNQYLYFVSDLMDGELADYLYSEDYTNLDLCDKINMKWKILMKILSGIESLHRVGIVHRDIKLENILFQKKPNRPLEFKISDFGLSCFKEQCGWGAGSLEFMPYQSIFLKEKQSFRDDFYALGVILFILITGRGFLEHVNYKELEKDFDEDRIDVTKVENQYRDNYKQQMDFMNLFPMDALKECTPTTKKKLTKMFELTKFLTQPNPPKDTITIENIKKILE
jgi:serine/threonine protein kinase